MPEAGDLVRALPDELLALEADRARLACGGLIPMIAAQSVVLPMPFRPTIATACSPSSNETSVEHVRAAVVGVQPFDREQARHSLR